MEKVKNLPHPDEHNQKSNVDVFEDEKHSLRFHLGINTRYHAKRSAFFQFWNNSNKILSYIAGSAAIVAILAKQYELYVALFNGIVLLLSACDSFIGFGDKARDYKEFYQAYKKLEIKLRDATTKDEITHLWKEADIIELNEPNTLLVLMQICWNEEAMYQGYDKSELSDISWYQTLFAQYIDLCPSKMQSNQTEVKSNEDKQDNEYSN